MPPWTAALSKLSRLGHHTCCIRRSRYQLQWPVMLGHSWLDATEKWERDHLPSGLVYVVHQNSHSTLSTTSDKVQQIIVWTLVCVSIHLHVECWLNKSRVEIVTLAAVGVACQQKFSYTSVIKFGNVNTIDVDSIHIQCTLGECEFNSHSKRIQGEKASSFGAFEKSELQVIQTDRHTYTQTNEYCMPSAHVHW